MITQAKTYFTILPTTKELLRTILLKILPLTDLILLYVISAIVNMQLFCRGQLRKESYCQGTTQKRLEYARFVCQISLVRDFFCFIGKKTFIVKKLSLEKRSNALSFCFYHGFCLRQKQSRNGKQRDEYFCFLHLDLSFLFVSRLV